jgi:putative SbcD/Mre11-related phosphoesterase
MRSPKPIDSEPALMLRRGKDRVMVFGDLHIGWEVALAQQGIHVPSQTAKMLERIRKIVLTEKPTKIIVLGDVKHSVTGAEIEEWRDVPEFFEALLKLVPQVQVIAGNHDGNLEPLTPNQVELIGPTGTALWNRFGLMHGHAWPSPLILGCETLILGHLHPAVTLHDALGYRLTKPAWVTAPCDPRKLLSGTMKAAGISSKGRLEEILKNRFHTELRASRCVFVPPFNDFLGGRPVNSSRIAQTHAGEKLGPILRSGAVDMEEAEVHLLDGTFLGRVDQLRALG